MIAYDRGTDLTVYAGKTTLLNVLHDAHAASWSRTERETSKANYPRNETHDVHLSTMLP
jgi:hypothetical protein